MPIRKNRATKNTARAALHTLYDAASSLVLKAQQSSGTAQSLPALNLKTTLIAPLNLTTPDDLNYSSSVGQEETAAAETFNLSGNADQPPPRRRYGHPNYHDSHTNADGSSKYSFFVGGGFTLPTGGTHDYASTGWKFQVGGGRNFNKPVGVMLQLDWDDFGMQTSTLNKQLALYNLLCGTSPNCQPLSQLGGNVHDWSFTIDPIVNFYTSDTFGAYVVGGLGFYHKYTQFTTLTTGVCFDPFYGYYQCQADQPIDWYTSNAFGLNGGIGLTYKLSRWANQRLYAEARYIWTDNSPRPFDVSGSTSYANAFPQASARTTYIPVTFGIRF